MECRESETLPNLNSWIEIHRLRFSLFLGCFEEERSELQDVEISIKVGLPKLPQACLTDEIENTVCYDKICSGILKNFEKKEFKLIESLGYQIYQFTRNLLPNDIKLQISVHKIKTPIESLKGGASFILGE